MDRRWLSGIVGLIGRRRSRFMNRSRPRLAPSYVVWLAMSLGACRGAKGADTLARCESALAEGDYVDAEKVCAAAFEESGASEAAVSAAKASFFSGNPQRVAPWLAHVPAGRPAAEIRYLMGSAALREHRVDEALGEFERARTELEVVKVWPKAMKVARKQAHVAWDNGRFFEAYGFMRIAIAHAESSADATAMLDQRVTLSELLLDLGAQRLSRVWLEHARRGPVTEDAGQRARLYFQQGLHAQHDRELELAIAMYEQALEAFVSADAWFEARSTQLNLAELYLLRGEPVAAERALDAAIESLGKAADGGYSPGDNDRCVIGHLRAQVALQSNEPGTALGVLNDTAQGVVPPDWAWRLAVVRGWAHRELGQHELAEVALRQAVEQMESLRDSAGPLDYRHFGGAARREPYERLFALLFEQDRVTEAVAVYERARSGALIEVMAEHQLRSLEAEHALGGLQHLRGLADPRLPDEIAAVPSGLSVLGHFVTEEQTYELSRVGGEWGVRGLGLGRPELRRLIASARTSDSPDWSALNERVAPMEGRFPRGSPLVVISESEFDRVSWASIEVGGVPLVDLHDIAYVPSLGALRMWSDRAEAARGGGVWIADSLGDLPAAAAAAEISAAGLGLPLLRRDRATVAALSDPAVGLWHLAVHAGTDARGAWLQLADGRLYADEIAKWSLAPQLVVLAGCRSALNEDPGVWGSLPAAFLAAGALRVVATLRSVGDDDAAVVMRRFYAAGGDTDPIPALARVQRELRREGWSVERWAPYVVIGAHTSGSK